MSESNGGLYALDWFKGVVSEFANKEMSEADFWRLQVIARDAIIATDVSSSASSAVALFQICEIVQILLGGTTSSIILREDGVWVVAAASGEGSENIMGVPLDMDRNSVTRYVIENKKPYFFSEIDQVEGVSKNNDSNRYSSNLFCSFPLLGYDGESLGVVSVAGMGKAHPVFHMDRSSMNGVLDMVAAKVAKIRKNEELLSAHENIESMKESETVREKLLYMAVHDLKNPLTLITANIAHLETMDLDENIMEIVKLSRFGGDRILDMVKSILDSYKMESGRMKLSMSRFDLANVIKGVIKDFEVAAQTDGVAMTYDGPEEISLEGDETLIRRVISNLLDNALRHSPIDSEVVIVAEQSDSRVTVRVVDNGEGIDKQDQDIIFNSFETARSSLSKGSDGGYGIGLAFCKMAVEAHGGEIGVASAPGEGAEFIFTFPKRNG